MFREVRAVVTTVLVVMLLAGFKCSAKGVDRTTLDHAQDRPDGAPFDHTFDLTPKRLTVGSQDFLVPAAYMTLSSPKLLYIEALLPGVDAISKQSYDCFRHANFCDDIVRIHYENWPSLPSFRQQETNLGLTSDRRGYDKNIDLEQYFREDGVGRPYFRAVDGAEEILILCVTNGKGQLTYNCRSSQIFEGHVLEINFRPKKLAEWRSIRHAVMARLSSFEVK